MSNQIISRSDELELLEQIQNSHKAEFIALYGRRRVGKTFLIKQFFKDSPVFFQVTGLKDGNMKSQLTIFSRAYLVCFKEKLIETPKTWFDAFDILTKKIQKLSHVKSIIIFFDELPWLATKRSGLMQALDYFWNNHWQDVTNFKLIVCGSAASWMLDKLVNAKAGLHNRLTKHILLKPFDLKETKEFFLQNKYKFSHKFILDIFMVTGGVPYYLEQINKNLSVAQNVNRLCFKEDGLLYDEFPRLFKSLFDHAEIHLSIIRTIADQRYGIARKQLISKMKLKSGGQLNKYLDELEAAGFIKRFTPYGKKRKEYYYRVIDEYSQFYLKWIEPIKSSGLGFTASHWQDLVKTPAFNSWAGYSFESLCLKHVEIIRHALHLQNTGCVYGSWRYFPKKLKTETDVQIDLLFDRDDQAITLCEIKYSDKPYVLDKETAKNIMRKGDVFSEKTKSQKQIFIALITASGLQKNLWSEELINNIVTLDDFFN